MAWSCLQNGDINNSYMPGLSGKLSTIMGVKCLAHTGPMLAHRWWLLCRMRWPRAGPSLLLQPGIMRLWE